MRIFSWVTKDTNINFMGMRKPAYVFSSLLVVLSVICIAVKGFNYGIDFSGGILMEVGSSRPVNLEFAPRLIRLTLTTLTCRPSAKPAPNL